MLFLRIYCERTNHYIIILGTFGNYVFRGLKLREYGLKYREEYRLYTRKPVCSSQTRFITIGFTECYFALVIMGYGMLLSIIVFVFELLWHKR